MGKRRDKRGEENGGLYNCEKMAMKVRYIGKYDTVAIDKDKIYEVISIEKSWYRIMTELDEDYLFPPTLFEIIEED